MALFLLIDYINMLKSKDWLETVKTIYNVQRPLNLKFFFNNIWLKRRKDIPFKW